MWAEYQYDKTLEELANDYDLTVARTREIVYYVAPEKIRKMKKYVKLVA
jgi:DNA-directed RNA polymerase sigma subunit (sigma70/sigma32)